MQDGDEVENAQGAEGAAGEEGEAEVEEGETDDAERRGDGPEMARRVEGDKWAHGALRWRRDCEVWGRGIVETTGRVGPFKGSFGDG